IRFDRDFEAALMDRLDRRRVELEQWFPAGADDEALAVTVERGPAGGDGVGEVVGAAELAAVGADADEVGVAEAADGAGAVLLAAGPEGADGEATEDGRPSGVGSFPLQGVEDLFDRVGHAKAGSGSW